MSRRKCIVLVGPPCSGKSATGKLVAEKLHIEYISSGEIAREMAKNDQSISDDLSNGKMAPEDKMRKLISNRIWWNIIKKNRNAVILDGFPRFGEQAEWLDNEIGRTFNIHYVLFYAPLSTIIERSTNRNRDDDKSLEQRLNYYYNITYNELCDRINITIDANENTVAECSELLSKFIKEVMKC